MDRAMKAALQVNSLDTKSTFLESLRQARQIGSSCRDSNTRVIINARDVCLFRETLAPFLLGLLGEDRPVLHMDRSE